MRKHFNFNIWFLPELRARVEAYQKHLEAEGQKMTLSGVICFLLHRALTTEGF
jgi:hypothetical protein